MPNIDICHSFWLTISDYIYNNPINDKDEINQLLLVIVAICGAIMGLSIVQSNFVIAIMSLLVRYIMAYGVPVDKNGEPHLNATQHSVLAHMPRSLPDALKQFEIDRRFKMFAVCPDCNFTNPAITSVETNFPIFPVTCSHNCPGKSGSYMCGTPLLATRQDGICVPLKPYLISFLPDYLVHCLADPVFLEQSMQATDDALYSAQHPNQLSTGVDNMFQAEFMKDFKGPDGKLFIDQGHKIWLAFSLHMDFFNPNHVTVRGNHDSIGIISAANLALDSSIQYLPEYILLGPKEPSYDDIDHFV